MKKSFALLIYVLTFQILIASTSSPNFLLPPLTIACEVTENVTVTGAMDGLASIEILDGVSPYTVTLLDTEIPPVPSLNGRISFPDLSVGVYMVEAIDANGDTARCSFIIRAPIICDFLVDKEVADITCHNAEDGTIDLSFVDGIAPFTINWSDASYDGQQSITGLAAGIYGVTVSDSLGCADTLSINIVEPLPVEVEIVQKNPIFCKGDFVVLNLEQVYSSYAWSTMDTTASILIGEAGSYSIKVTDSIGCTAMDTVQAELIKQDTIREEFFTCDPSRTGDFYLERRNNSNGCMDIVFRTLNLAMVDTVVSETTTCDPDEAGFFVTTINNNTGCSGLILETVTLLRSDTTYLVETSCFPQDTGVIMFNFINQLGCDSIVEIKTTLDRLDECLISFNAFTDTICPDESTLTIHLTATFGNPPFSYFIIDTLVNDTLASGVIETIEEEMIIDNLPKRDYKVKLINQSTNLGVDQLLTFTTHPTINITTNLSDYANFEISCSGAEDGSIELISEDNQPLFYLWETGETTPVRKDLAAGIYRVTISNEQHCQLLDTFELSAPDTLTIDYQENNPICEGENLGQFTITNLSNANGTAEYSLDGVLFQPLEVIPFTISDLEIGAYELYLQDENDCQLNTIFDITPPIEKRLELEKEVVLNLGDSLILSPAANFKIAEFQWTATVPIPCMDCPEIRQLPIQDGQYMLTTLDENGCSISTSSNVRLRKEQQVFIPNVFSPNGDGINDRYQIFMGKSIKRIQQFQIFDEVGRLMYQVNDRLPNDTSIGWDGQFRGQKMSPAVFVVLMEVTLIDETTKQYRETMTLIK